MENQCLSLKSLSAQLSDAGMRNNSAKSGRSTLAGMPVFFTIRRSTSSSGFRSPASHLDTDAVDTPNKSAS
jgi:hypothetical protein